MIDIRQFQKYIVRPVLDRLKMGGLAAERLMIGTALAESRMTYIDQINRGEEKPGPAYGIYQQEQGSHDDIWLNYLPQHPDIALRVRQLAIMPCDAQQMAGNLYYATAMARLHYWRLRFIMPSPLDYKAMAGLWKMYYNTVEGAGTAEKAEKWFRIACSETTS